MRMCHRPPGNEDSLTANNYFASNTVLPSDVGREFMGDIIFRRYLTIELFCLLDTSLESWEGLENTSEPIQEQDQAQLHNDSLFYIFNTLPSPSPSPTDVLCPIAKASMTSLLNEQPMPGLKTSLYPYQKRSAAEMVRRETEPSVRLSPRFEIMKGPTGEQFFFDSHTGDLSRNGQEYEDARGGILAEVRKHYAARIDHNANAIQIRQWAWARH